MKKKIVLVTGASRGLGKGIAKKLSDEGMIIIGTSTTTKGTKKINSYLKNGIGVKLDLLDMDSINNGIKHIYSKFNFIDILINNAGIIRDKLYVNMKLKDWNNVLHVNLNSIFYLSQSIIKKMIRKKSGKMITIGSVIGHLGNYGQTNYSASKSALIGFHKSLALEVAHKGITVNMISPGLIETDMIRQLTENQKQKYLSRIPMKRFGKIKEVAAAVSFLTSDDSNYITGQIIHINGGMYMP